MWRLHPHHICIRIKNAYVLVLVEVVTVKGTLIACYAFYNNIDGNLFYLSQIHFCNFLIYVNTQSTVCRN
jgi:hypothetical protein